MKGFFMDRYTNAILTILKDQFIKVNGEKPFQSEEGMRVFYTENLNDNLYRPMDANALAAYGRGSGDEIGTGKMQALRSSSALTYNLFWDQIAEVKSGGNLIGDGVYKVEFEKQYHTLKPSVSRFPANLDAFLYCKHTKEAVACEMKMTEWIFNKPGMLRAAYLNPDNYIDEAAGKVFTEVAKELILHNDYEDPETEKNEYPSVTSRYDAFQMFKHTVACYTAIVQEEPREIEKLTLVNCAWTLSDPNQLEQKLKERYIREEWAELEEFDQFRKVMGPVKELFRSKGVQFEICFYTFAEFLRLFDKTQDELNYLRRYTLD